MTGCVIRRLFMTNLASVRPRLYVDSAEVDRVASLLNAGLVHGVTTNPTILARGGKVAGDIPELYARWESEGAREIFFQTWGGDTAAYLRNAEALIALGERVVVKVPATAAGFAAARWLVAQGVTVLVTAVYSVAQALTCATLGVAYIAPYLGRMRDAGMDGDGLISAMQAVCAGTDTNVLAASLRSAADIVALRLADVPYFTAAPSVIEEMLFHAVSETSAAEFDAEMVRLSVPLVP